MLRSRRHDSECLQERNRAHRREVSSRQDLDRYAGDVVLASEERAASQHLEARVARGEEDGDRLEAGHLVPMERPDLVADEALAFYQAKEECR